MNAPLSRFDIVVAKHECIELVTHFFTHYDNGEHDLLMGLMTPDGVWIRPDGPARVGPELLAALAKRKASVTVLHILSNFAADVRTLDSVSVTALMTIVRDDEGTLTPPPAKISPPTAILSFTAHCVRIDQDWRIKEIDHTYIFRA